jgi:alkylhydroperoxidase family enzyme
MAPPRIAPIDAPDEEQRELLAKTLLGPDGRPLNLFSTLARRPRLLRRVNALGGYFMAHGDIPVRARELVILRVAARAESSYELGQHRWIAARAGLTSAEIDAAAHVGSAHAWAAADRAVLDLADELASTDAVTDALWDRLGAHFDDDQRIEMLVLAGFYRMLACVLNGLRVELDTSVAELNRSAIRNASTPE